MAVPTACAQLGVIRLELYEACSSQTEWISCSAELLQRYQVLNVDQMLLQSLCHLLQDPGVGFEASYRVVQNHAVIRCWLLPSDGIGSQWKRTLGKSSQRGIHLRRVFDRLQMGWEDEPGSFLLSLTADDTKKMPELYATVPSPEIPVFERSNSTGDDDMISRLTGLTEPIGVKTTMYSYQHRSVGKMVQMEIEPKKLIDPRWTAFEEQGREGMYYVNLQTWDIQRHPGWYDLPRGGILCEQMGVGKTLMCLALICATIHQPCLPAQTSLGTSFITTQHRFMTSPAEKDVNLRKEVGCPEDRSYLERPSLLALCANLVSIYNPSAQKSIQDHLRPLVQQNPFYFEFPPDNTSMREAKRKTLKRMTKKIYLANTTLIVVPGILVHQWEQEIEKHLSPSSISYRIIGNTEEMPDIEDLIEHDIIIMSVEQFGREERVRFTAGTEDSVLLQARWKRLILDEGHVAGQQTSNAMLLAMKLSVERRWAVSGTPTRHLQQGGEIGLDTTSREISPDPDLHQSQAGTSSRQSRNKSTYAWSKRDLDDARRIGVMIGGFLAAEPFKSDAAFQDRVTAPLCRPSGPAFGAVRRMRYLMSSLMVKHAPKVIDIESELPPSVRCTEILKFHPMQRLSYNVLAALVATNVYTSLGEDQDYLLHPSNTKSFNSVISNLHLACFWFSAKEMGAEDCLARIQHHLETNNDTDSEARARLEEAVEHLQCAINTPGWTEWMQNGVSIPFEAPECFSTTLRESWSDSADSISDAVDSHSLQHLKEANKKGTTEHELCLQGWDKRVEKCKEYLEEMKRTAGVKGEPLPAQGSPRGKGKVRAKDGRNHEPISAANQPSKIPRPVLSRKRKRSSDQKDDVEERLEEAVRNAESAQESGLARINVPRPLPTEIITVSRSAKVNFVLKTVLASETSDKFVIFGESSELGHMVEALDLVDVINCFVGYSSKENKRLEGLLEFERPEVRVCLLDLRLAARGLNLVIANRMIFLSPVWNLDVLAQAVKRVHRIGQTRPTTVQILATEGTFEEDIANREVRSRNADDEKLYSRALIENPRFVYAEKLPTEKFTINFIPYAERIMGATALPAIPSTPIMEIDPASPASTQIITPTASSSPLNMSLLHHERTVLTGILKLGGATSGNMKPKKRARVAFD